MAFNKSSALASSGSFKIVSKRKDNPTIEGMVCDMVDVQLAYLSDSRESRHKDGMSKRDMDFMSDISSLVGPWKAKPMSTSQAELCIKIISKYVNILVTYAGYDEDEVKGLLNKPVYEKEPYKTVFVPREVRYVGNGKLAFRSKYNKNLIEKFKEIEGSYFCHWVKEHRITMVPIKNETQLNMAMDIIQKHDFKFDDDVVQFLTHCSNTGPDTLKTSISDGRIRIEFGDHGINQMLKLIKTKDNDFGDKDVL